jgi:adhesin transport system outer membrane protein
MIMMGALAVVLPARANDQNMAQNAMSDAVANTIASPVGPQLNQSLTDPQLQMALDMATSTHPTIAAAKAGARAAGADVRAARWQRFPSFSVEGQLLDQRENRLQPAATVEQPLWAGGRIGASISRARHQRDAALARLDSATLEIALAVVQSYHEWHRLDQRQIALTESRDQHQRMVETMERRVAQEISPLSDYELASSRLAQIEQQLSVAMAQRQSAQQRLRELVGDPGYVPNKGPLPLPEWPILEREAMINEASDYSPALRQLRAESLAARSEAQISRAAILPQLNGQYSYSEIYGHRVGLVLRAQSDGGLSRFAAADAARSRQQSSELQIVAGERSLRDQIIADHVEYQSASSRLTLSNTAMLAAERVRESYLRQFISGRRTWLDVMNAVREATSAQIEFNDTQASALATMNRLLLRTGRFRPAGEQGDHQ